VSALLTFGTSGNTLLDMGDSGPSVNLSADALDYLGQKFLKLFGKDNESVQRASWFRGLQETALTQTATVHCVSMRKPLSFDSVYQPTRLLVETDEGEVLPTGSYAWDDRVMVRIPPSEPRLRGYRVAPDIAPNETSRECRTECWSPPL
jgi:hypothetical protein